MSWRYSSIEIFPSLDVSASSKRLVRAGDKKLELFLKLIDIVESNWIELFWQLFASCNNKMVSYLHGATATVPKMDSYINFVYSYNLPFVMLFDYLNWDFVNIYRDGLVNVTLMVPIVPQLFGDNWNHPVLIKKNSTLKSHIFD